MPAQNTSVLIVDDNFNIRAALRAFAERTMGMRVCASAANGVEAVARAEEHRPDLVLIDLSMPMMNGLDAAATIRKAVPHAHIVVFTLFSDNLGQLLAKAAGVDLVVSKAEGAAGLLHALEPFLANRLATARTTPLFPV